MSVGRFIFFNRLTVRFSTSSENSWAPRKFYKRPGRAGPTEYYRTQYTNTQRNTRGSNTTSAEVKYIRGIKKAHPGNKSPGSQEKAGAPGNIKTK